MAAQSMEAEKLPIDKVRGPTITDVYGVGPKLREDLMKRGENDPHTLWKLKDLPHSTRMFSKYFDDLVEPIPRDEVEKIVGIITKSTFWTKEEEIIPIGSYRRGNDKMGDIDILVVTNRICGGCIFKKQPPIDEVNGFSILSKGDSKATFLCRPFKKVRMVELYFAPSSERGAAILTYTGNRVFNIVMRRVARSKGFLLSQHGLFKLDGKELVEAASEEKIFEKLGIPFVPPSIRATDEGLRMLSSETTK